MAVVGWVRNENRQRCGFETGVGCTMAAVVDGGWTVVNGGSVDGEWIEWPDDDGGVGMCDGGKGLWG